MGSRAQGHGGPQASVPTSQTPACDICSQGRVLTTQNSLGHRLRPACWVCACSPGPQQGKEIRVKGCHLSTCLFRSPCLPSERKPSAPLTTGKNTEWEPRDPWTTGCRAAVYKLRLFPAQKFLGSKLLLPRPRSCGRKMLGAPCWPIRGTDPWWVGGNLLNPTRGTLQASDESRDVRLAHPQ